MGIDAVLKREEAPSHWIEADLDQIEQTVRLLYLWDTRLRNGSRLRGPAPRDAMKRKRKQNSTGSSPRLRIGQNPFQTCTVK
jgi:hypothetical protein